MKQCSYCDPSFSCFDGTADCRKRGMLKGTSKTITVSEFRETPGEIFDQVQSGRTFTVTKNGSPIATLSQPELSALQLGKACRQL